MITSYPLVVQHQLETSSRRRRVHKRRKFSEFYEQTFYSGNTAITTTKRTTSNKRTNTLKITPSCRTYRFASTQLKLVRQSKMNSTSNFTGYVGCGIPKDSEEKIVLKILAYSAIFCVAIAGNLRVIVLVMQSSNMRRRTINLFVVNMAISDLLISLFAMPRTMIGIGDGTNGVWYIGGNIGNALCKLCFFVQDTATAVSMESLIIIACDRYFALAYPTHAAPTTKRRLLIIIVTWVIGGGVHFPYLFIYNIITYPIGDVCTHTWSQDRNEHFTMTLHYYFAQFTLFVLIPIVLLTALYSGILYKLKQQGYLIRSVSNGSSSSKRRREYHVLKMAIAILVACAVCWVPFNTYVFILVFIWKFTGPCNLHDVQFFVFFMAFSNSAINPCIYIYFSRNFQKLSKRHLTTKKRVVNFELMEFCRVRDRIQSRCKDVCFICTST